MRCAWMLAFALIGQQDVARPSFTEWLVGVRQEALSRGIRQEIVDQALSGIDEPMPIVLERDRTQAETILPLEAYIARLLTKKFVRTGREKYGRHRALLAEVGEHYGVPPHIIAGIWGVESNFGRFSGVRPTIAALATLAWDPRRSVFFRGELLKALEILNQGDIDLAHMRGSWAGAMGQVQFLPSSYLKFAEDFDGDGRRDIWSTPADVFASIANYLKGHGWTAGQTWGREVRVSATVARRIGEEVGYREGSCRATREMTLPLPMKRWQQLGVTLPNGRRLGPSDSPASLVSGATRHFLVFPNYDALLEYNCSHAYALSVALLGETVARSPAASAAAPPTKGARRRRRA